MTSYVHFSTMELKVWVDGIQKVVCGVTYNTTCHDVVLALACALGQTGRFSLVEKWRDSERPLIPDECPLQLLHKLGTYAGEVRYYLIQAGVDTAGQQQVVGQKADVPTSNLQQFGHNFSLPDQPHHLHSSEFIKRSSTFSGAHQSFHRTKSSLSQSATALSQQRYAHTSVTPVSPSTVATDSGGYVTSNGKPGGLSLNAISRSPLRSHYGSVQNASESCSLIEATLQPQINSHFTFSEDAGKHRSANMSSSYSQGICSYSSLRHKNNNSVKQLQRMSTDQPSPQTFHSNPGQAQQPTIESSQQHHPSSSQCDHPIAMIKPQQRQQSRSSQSPYVTKKSDQQPHPVPSPRHHIAPSSPVLVPESVPPAHVRLKDSHNPQQKEKSRDEYLQSVLDNVPYTVTNFTRSISTDGVEASNVNASGSKVHTNNLFQHSQDNTALNKKPSSILRIAREYLQKNGNLQKLDHPGENTQGRVKLKNTSESSSDNTADVIKYATLDRHFTRSKPHPALPSRSLSIGHGDEDQKSDNKPLIRPQRGFSGDCFQYCAEEKTSDVIKTEKSTNNSINKQMSSFASAVAHIRQFNGSVGNNKANIAHIRQHSEGAMMKPVNTGSHVRQHSSDSSYTDSHLMKEIFTQSSDHVQAVIGQRLIGFSDSNSKYKNTSLQQSNVKPSSSFSCPSLLHKSAPSNVRRQSSHQESCIPKSNSSAPSNKFSENIQVDRIGSNTGVNYSSSNNKNQESSHSEQEKLECEDSVCNQNFPDLATKNAAKYKGANKNEKLDVSREADAALNQADREYRQLLTTVDMQQERIKLQEAQINAADLEITSLEEKDTRNKEKLQVILEEISSFEVHEAIFKEELDNLEKTEWISVLEKEHELDVNMNLQITHLKAKLEHMKSEIKQQEGEEDKKRTEINSEEEREAQEKKQNEQLQKQVTSEKEELEEQLNMVNIVINEKNLQLENLEKDILEVDTVLNEKEEQVKNIEEELKTEAKMTNCQSEVHSVFPVKMNSGTFPVSDSGEAILKILECQLSAQSPPTSPFNDEVDNLGGITSAQHLYTLGSMKTHNGIWV